MRVTMRCVGPIRLGSVLMVLVLMVGLAGGTALAAVQTAGQGGEEDGKATASAVPQQEAGQQQEQEEQEQQEQGPANPFLDLGTERGVGGEDFMRFDRGLIKDQILQFIPPLLQPAFVGHAFVLPPGTFRVSIAARTAKIRGQDFFKGGESNLAGFRDFEVTRQFVDLDLFYGFDLNRRFLHGFTLRVNVPYLSSSTNGAIHPNGVPFISLMANGSSQAIGDVSVFLKKKVLDQGNAPFGLAVAGAVRLPTGSNEEKFGNNGFILARRPDPDGDGVQMSFDALIRLLGGPQNFFNGAWTVPASMLTGAPQVMTPFPFNGGVFGRFSGDGRLPSVLQPGTGSFGAMAGVFFTRQFEPSDFGVLGRFPGRSALHAGVLHQFNKASDGVDPGDQTTFFASFVKPVHRDYLALDLTFVGFHQQEDQYEGFIPEPELRIDPDTGIEMFSFDRVERPGFTGGTTLMLAPSLILSPDPQLRFTATGLFRIKNPDLGPAPNFVLRLASAFTF